MLLHSHSHLLGVLCFLAATTTTAAATAARVCPDVPKTDKAFLLEVSNANIALPNGKKMTKGLVYNSSYIGPLITADLGEKISVDVVNKANVGTSVHWHGMDLPDAAWADGVDGVTQRPIPPKETFRYKFQAEPAGTLWYHSHVGMQFADGLRGPLIVKDPDDPYKDAYDEEVVLLMTDQNAESGEEELKALQQGTASMAMGKCSDVSAQDWSDAPFTTLLTNGKGFMTDPTTKQPVGSPFVVKVQKGKRYRFRVISGAASWGIKVKVQGHDIDIIALDGSNVEATPAKGFVFTPGERVDFLLHANKAVGNYWIDVATLTGSNSPVLLSYEGADAHAAGPPKLTLGCKWALPEPGVLDFKNKTLRPHASVPAPPPKADTTLVVYLSNNADPSQSKQAVLGGRAILGMQTATAKPRAGCAKLPDGRSSAYCWTLNWNEFGGARNGVPLLFPGAELSSSTYVQPVAYGAVVDVVLINPGTMVHPMHLHGQRFWVLGAGNGDILTADSKLDYSKLNPNSKRAIMRDTQPVANAVPGTAQPARKKMAVMSAATAPAMPGMGAAPGRRLKQGMADMADSMEPAVKPPPMSNMGARQQPKATKPAVRAAPMPGATDGMAGMPAAAAGNTPKADASAGDGMRGMEAAAPSSLTPGYSVIRFKANNPGVWPFHCHIDLHANSGMMMAFKVMAPKGRRQASKSWSLPKGVAACGLTSDAKGTQKREVNAQG